MRSARLQSQDLGRTGQFINTLLSKDDVKDLERPEAPEPPKPSHMVNGNQYRADAKGRFSDPPAPPPQQPLPEKPDGVPSLKRGTTERPKSHPPNASPIRQDNQSQVLQLQEALTNMKTQIDTQSARMRDLEEMLQKERAAREVAEMQAKRLEDAAASQMNESLMHPGVETLLDEAFEPPKEENDCIETDVGIGHPSKLGESMVDSATEAATAAAAALQARLDTALLEMQELRQQMETWKQRCDTAEAERDADRKSLAEMVLQIRKDEEARQVATQNKRRSHSKSRNDTSVTEAVDDLVKSSTIPLLETNGKRSSKHKYDGASDDPGDGPTLSRANTITPLSTVPAKLPQDQVLMAGLPYASMLGVVLIGMGLMAYINGWQPQPKLD
jgi:hypothetical protein